MAVPAQKFEYFIIEKLNLQKKSHTATVVVFFVLSAQNGAVQIRLNLLILNDQTPE